MTLHPAAVINHAIRSISFAYSFLVVGVLLWERGAGPIAWLLLVLQFIVYPQLVYLRARLARDSRRAELDNLLLDAVLLGAWIAALSFPIWAAFGALFSTALNNGLARGLKGTFGSIACFAIGAACWVAIAGFAYTPATSALVTALCFAGSLAYAVGVARVSFVQRAHLRAARQALRTSEERYRLIAENAGDLVGLVDAGSRWLYASPSYARLLGAQDVRAGADAFSRVHVDDVPRVSASWNAARASGTPCTLRMRLHAQDGSVRVVETACRPTRDADGTVTGLVLASRDVTELHRSEQQAAIAAQAFERMAEGIMITGADGTIVSVNESYTRITGYAADEVIGNKEAAFRKALQPGHFYREMYAEVERTGYWTGTTWSERKNGALYREWRSISAVRGSDGRISHYVNLLRDANGPHATAQAA